MSDDSTDPQNTPADAVVPPPPPETPIPDGLLSAPPSDLASRDAVIPPASAEIPPADAVIPPPPPEAVVPGTRRGSRAPAVLSDDQPSAVADDWAQPSVAPEVPSSGGYRALSATIFVFLVALLVAAVAVGVYLLTNVPLTFSLSAVDVDTAAGAAVVSLGTVRA